MGMAGGMGGFGGGGGAAAAGLDDDRWACSWVGAAQQLCSCTDVSALLLIVQWHSQRSCVVLLVAQLPDPADLPGSLCCPVALQRR